VSKRIVKDEYVIYYNTDIGPTVSAIIAHVKAREDALVDLRVERPSLEDRFLEITTTGGVQ
jgi:ABC-2 type transport system ATP-binding protein